jgi:tRNA threonylcarbamoyladenosine biosynthesis protein TsaB
MKHINDITADSWLCPMIDARRMEVYTALYNTQLQEMRAASAVVVDEHSFDDIIAEHDIYFVGEGAAKCKDVICGERVHFEYLKSPLAEDMLEIALQMLRDGKVADIAAFEPFYLKDFVAAPSHIKGLL